MLAIDKTHLELIHSIVSEFSFEGCPFSDDSLSSKKLYPGAAFTSRLGKNSPWRPRLVVTSHSFELFIQMIRQQHKSSVHKGKLPKATMEEKAEICAAASALGLEVLRTVPNAQEDVDGWEPQLWQDQTPYFKQCLLYRST